jgi:RND family efflux transporter MFP subunit
LSLLVPGKITNYPIREGQEIKKVQLISQLDDSDYKSRYDAAIAEFNNLKANYERAEKLRKTDYISQSELDQIKAQKDIGATNVKLLKTALNNTRLVAPFSGVIAKTFVNKYTDIQVKQPIVSLQDNSSLKVVISVPENTVVKESQKTDSNDIKFHASFAAIANEVFDLDIHSYETEADPVTRTYKVTLNILDTKGYQLYPGLTTQVTLDFKNPAKKTFNLPVSALFTSNEDANEQYIWVIDEQNKVHKRKVEVSEIVDNHVVLINGISENEKVVTAGIHYLRENQLVKLLLANKTL